MKSTFVLPKELLDEARKVSEIKTKTQVIIVALEEFIRRRKSRDLLQLRGSLKDSDFNYKSLRKKR